MLGLKTQLDALYERATQTEIAQWALEVSRKAIVRYAPSFATHQTVLDGYGLKIRRQQGTLLNLNDLRQARFATHRLAKSQDGELTCTALRVVGQAVASAHMKGHGTVASDYAIKCCLACPNDVHEVVRERIWEINALSRICDETN